MARASRIGAVAVPLSMAAALAVLATALLSGGARLPDALAMVSHNFA
jgi:hypothetical protein